MDFMQRAKPGRKKTRKDDDKCLVCGDKSVGANFGVNTCAPCKAFFRRNAVRLGTFQFRCRGDGNCAINIETRRHCICCRLAKCFRVGMNRNAILTDDQRLERNQRIESNRLKRVENNQPIIRSSNLLRFHSSSLSTNDQILLTNIFSAYERTCVSLKYEQHRNIPKNDTFSLQKFMNSCGHMYTALIDYFKFIPEFSNLSFSFKKSLIKNNLNQIFRLNSALVIKASGSVDDPDFPFFRRIFPPDLFIDLHKCIIALLPFIHDPILLKLIFIVLMFSTHLSLRYECDSNESESTDSTIVMFNAQSIYVELLWRYILSRASNYRQAVLLFSSFITCLIYSQNVSIKLQEYISRTTSNQAGHLAPIMQVMWSKDQKQ